MANTTIRDGSVNKLMGAFFEAIQENNRIGPVHVSLYMALLYERARQGFADPFHIFSHTLMPMAKISGSATYYRTIRDLHRFGFIRYMPSHNYMIGSEVYMLCIGPLGETNNQPVFGVVK